MLGPHQSQHQITANNAKITQHITRLVSLFARGRESSAAVDFAVRILQSRIAPSVAADETHISDLIKKKLVKRDSSMDDALKFSAWNHKLSQLAILNRKWAILHCLLTISDQRELIDVRENPMDNAFSVMGLKSIKAAPKFQPLPQAFEPDANVSSNFEKKVRDAFRSPRGPCNGYYLLGGKGGTLEVNESLLLRDMLFIFQDIDGKFIKYNSAVDAYVFVDGVWIPPPTLENISRLSEVGWLYKKIKGIVDGWSQIGNENDGLIRQGFAAGIQNELALHFHLIAQLEDQFTKAELAGTQEFAAKGLSLKRLLVWVHEPLLKLRLISVLVDSSEDLRGGALLSMIHGYTNHGDPFVQSFVEKMLKEISLPFYQMLKRWLYEGELNDPFQEFFVVYDRNVDADNMWRKQYVLRPEMIPSFLNRSVAKKSYLIGKSLNFIRYCCGEETYVIERSQELESYPAGYLEYGDSSMFEKSIGIAYQNISAHILELLFTKYKLISHLQALKKYLLLGQGDLVQNLMDKLGMDLSKPANSILRHNLTGILESSIRSSNAQHDDPDILRRLDVRLLEISSGDSGWDVFTLDYHTDSPISTVFPTQSMHQYMKVEHALSVSWRKGMTEYTEYRKMKNIGQLFHFCNGVLSEMIHFTYQLQYYILFEVLECSWNELNAYLSRKTGDLDQLIGAHNKYLNNITSRGLLAATTGTNNMFSMLVGLFDVILKFQLGMVG
ncbi:Gamma-tubulin complex component 3 [Physocladia obscura]|uniref:Gamma-tubulin complex component 3 n=1 Tax=Physocladia obscura TaxID=109957 RepID=A0AAD5T2T0_9FUNG|nr:Gamma-tubulin complex component 3 [Physocladia obscura]